MFSAAPRMRDSAEEKEMSPFSSRSFPVLFPDRHDADEPEQRAERSPFLPKPMMISVHRSRLDRYVGQDDVPLAIGDKVDTGWPLPRRLRFL